MVCHDKHDDRGTRYELYVEIYNNGGKVIRISKDSGQPVLLALGKVLVQREHWREFFATHKDGMVVVHETGFTPLPPEMLMKKVLRLRDIDAAVLKTLLPRKRTVSGRSLMRSRCFQGYSSDPLPAILPAR